MDYYREGYSTERDTDRQAETERGVGAYFNMMML